MERSQDLARVEAYRHVTMTRDHRPLPLEEMVRRLNIWKSESWIRRACGVFDEDSPQPPSGDDQQSDQGEE